MNNTNEIDDFGKIANVDANNTSDKKVEYKNILVVKDNIDVTNREYFTRLEVETVSVPEEDVNKYSDRIVTKATVDASTGLLFNKEKCDKENKEIRYYISGKEPKQLCNKLHIF